MYCRGPGTFDGNTADIMRLPVNKSPYIDGCYCTVWHTRTFTDAAFSHVYVVGPKLLAFQIYQTNTTKTDESAIDLKR
jgi:hypothetical protein